MRIRLLDRLREAPATVGELTAELEASQQNVSKHLGVLHGAGVVTREKVGTSVRYAITDDSVFEICEIVCVGCAVSSTSSTERWKPPARDDGLVRRAVRAAGVVEPAAY